MQNSFIVRTAHIQGHSKIVEEKALPVNKWSF